MVKPDRLNKIQDKFWLVQIQPRRESLVTWSIPGAYSKAVRSLDVDIKLFYMYIQRLLKINLITKHWLLHCPLSLILFFLFLSQLKQKSYCDVPLPDVIRVRNVFQDTGLWKNCNSTKRINVPWILKPGKITSMCLQIILFFYVVCVAYL